MDSSEETTCTQRQTRIRQLNDQLRTEGVGGRTVLTRAIAALAPELIQSIFHAVRQFDTFATGNDPWGEQDFGQVVVEGESYFWKIDAYDINYEFASPDPSDEAVTCRIMTIMTAWDL